MFILVDYDLNSSTDLDYKKIQTHSVFSLQVPMYPIKIKHFKQKDRAKRAAGLKLKEVRYVRNTLGLSVKEYNS